MQAISNQSVTLISGEIKSVDRWAWNTRKTTKSIEFLYLEANGAEPLRAA